MKITSPLPEVLSGQLPVYSGLFQCFCGGTPKTRESPTGRSSYSLSPDRIIWNRPLLPATERLRLVGVFKTNRKTLAKLEGIFLLYLLLGWMSTNGFNRGKGG